MLERFAGQIWFAIASTAFSLGALRYLFLGFKELNSAMQDYFESKDRNEEYQKLAYLKVDNTKSLRLFLKADALVLAATITHDAFRGSLFYTYAGIIILIALAIAWHSEKKYREYLKRELGIK